MPFVFRQKILFKHCDPAGIVFYPRYFEMINDCIEAFFDEEIGVPFEVLLRDGGVPTAEMFTRFNRPSRHGDHLELTLIPVKLKSRSLSYEIVARCEGERRFTVNATLVYVNSNRRAAPWPDAIHTPLKEFSEDSS